MTGSVELSASVSFVGNYLRIDFGITNNTDSGIYAHALPIDGRFNAYVHDAYACVSGDNQVLQLLLGETPVPKNVSLSARVQPHAVLIAAHDSFDNHLLIEIPICEWHAYSGRDCPEGTEEVTVDEIVLKIEYVLEEDSYFSEPTPHDGYFQVDGFPLNALTFSEKLPRPVKVLKRTAMFERFAV